MSRVNAIALSPDGKRVVSLGDNDAMRMWNIDTGTLIAEWTENTRLVTSLCWDRDGGQVVSGSKDGIARVWDVGGKKILRVIKTGLEYLEAVIYSPDMTMIATGGGGRRNVYIKILDAKTGKLIANLEGHRLEVQCLAWTSDGRTLISGAADCLIRTWNTTTWQQINVMRGHADDIESIVISPNGRILASGSVDKTARLWNLENGQPIGSPLQHVDSVTCVSFSADGKLLATGDRDRNAYSWDISAIAREAHLDELLWNPNVS
jgi:WD40 repeat protein